MNEQTFGVAWRGRLLSLLALSIIMLTGGCDSKDLKKLGDDLAKKKDELVKRGTDLAEEGKSLLPETGKITLGSATPIETSTAIATMHVVGDGRKNSVQITSYTPGATSTGYPAVFIHAATEIETLALLADKTIDCNIYVDLGSGGPLARNDIGKPIPVKFGPMNMQEKTIIATIESCTLFDTNNERFEITSGNILAVVEEN